jgi:hypothetical protein
MGRGAKSSPGEQYGKSVARRRFSNPSLAKDLNNPI